MFRVLIAVIRLGGQALSTERWPGRAGALKRGEGACAGRDHVSYVKVGMNQEPRGRG